MADIIRRLQADFQLGEVVGNGLNSLRRPDAIAISRIQAFTRGPKGSDPVGRLYYVRVENDIRTVYLAQENAAGDGWDPETVLFIFTGIQFYEISVAYDLSGRLVIAAERPSRSRGGVPEIWLYRWTGSSFEFT